MRLSGCTCLVTGAASGIGRATVLALAEAGADVVASDLPTVAPDESSMSPSGHFIGCDLSRHRAAAELASAAVSLHGHIDVLVNCAGIGLYRSIADLDEAVSERLVAVNLLAPIELTRLLLPGMLERGRGHVVNVGSIVGYVARPHEAVYAASKAALAVFTESLRAETRPHGVSASLVVPVAVETRFFVERGVPYGRSWPRPLPAERVADAIVGAIGDDRAQVFLPRWLSLLVRFHALNPRSFRALATTFDRPLAS
jgi:short-subunit dehydrogenase